MDTLIASGQIYLLLCSKLIRVGTVCNGRCGLMVAFGGAVFSVLGAWLVAIVESSSLLGGFNFIIKGQFGWGQWR